MKSLSLILLLVLTLVPSLGRAADSPDYLSLGGGGYDFDKDQDRRKSVDYRIEYEWGTSLLPLIDSSFNSVEPFIQMHPTLGFEGNSRGAVFGNGGLNFDVPFLRHGIFTWGEALGAFDPGHDPRPLGAILEFRSQLELGWQFDNKLRLTGFISHISNAHILSDDPGAEIVGAYVHIPLSGWKQK